MRGTGLYQLVLQHMYYFDVGRQRNPFIESRLTSEMYCRSFDPPEILRVLAGIKSTFQSSGMLASAPQLAFILIHLYSPTYIVPFFGGRSNG